MNTEAESQSVLEELRLIRRKLSEDPEARELHKQSQAEFLKLMREDPNLARTISEHLSLLNRMADPWEGPYLVRLQSQERLEYLQQRNRELEKENEKVRLENIGLKQQLKLREDVNQTLEARIEELNKELIEKLTEKSERELAEEYEKLSQMAARGIKLHKKTKDIQGLVLAWAAMQQMDEDPNERFGWVFLNEQHRYVVKKLREFEEKEQEQETKIRPGEAPAK